MDHVHATLKSYPDDVVLGEISTDRSKTFSNLVCFIGLHRCYELNDLLLHKMAHLLTMSRQPIFIRKDRDGVHSQFMGGSEYTDGNFLSNRHR